MLSGSSLGALRELVAVAGIPILSVVTCSTSSPYDILKVLRKIIEHNPPVGRDKHDD
jgi:hypothetical protein